MFIKKLNAYICNKTLIRGGNILSFYKPKPGKILVLLFLFFLPLQNIAFSQLKIISKDQQLCSQLGKVLAFQDGIIASNIRNEIILLSLSGRIIWKTGGFGGGKESFGNLKDITVFRDLKIYAVDFDRQKILNFDHNLNLLGSLTNNLNWPIDYQFTQPGGLQIAQTGEWFIIDQSDRKLIKLDIRGEPEWAYYFPLGGDQLYWQDLQLLQINTAKRQLHLYDGYYDKIYTIDYWGNQIAFKDSIEALSSIFIWGKEEYLLVNGKVRSLYSEMNLDELRAKINTIPGNIKFISSGKLPTQLIVLSDEILVFIDE